MNRIERFVYDIVKDNPRLRTNIRDIYQSLLDIVPVPDIDTSLPVVTRSRHFFGFHDKTPFSCGDRFLASHRELVSLRMPAPEDEVEIGVFEGQDWVAYRRLGQTRAWNWQQGSMLQWVGNSDVLVFNDFDGTSHVARLVDGRTGVEVHRVPFPIGAVSADGSLAASYDFVRSNIGMPGYGYAQGADPERDRLVPERHGLAIGDLATGGLRTLHTVAGLVKIEPQRSMEQSFHWITHCQFSPGGRRVMFFHRWVKADGGLWTRMLSCNTDGSDLHLFPTVRMVSHAAWRSERDLLAYARTAHGDGYYLFTDRTGDYTRIGADRFSSDGHPQFTQAGRYFVTDTYPDRFRRQRLYVYNMDLQELRCVGTFASPKKFQGRRPIDSFAVDLHPRWNRGGNTICFDSGHSGERSLCTIRLPWL